MQTLRDVSGSYTMASSPRDRPSHAPYPDRCTVFTGALVDVLDGGVEGGPGMLGLHAVCEAVAQRIAALKPAAPQTPQDEDHNGVGGLDFVRNRAVLPALFPEAPPPVPPRHRVRWSLAAGAAGLALGLLAQPGLTWWRDAHPGAAAGMCGSHAELLDHSDALNKKQVDNEPIGGLSAIAFLPGDQTRALTVADNDSGRVFPLRLGSLTGLDPRPSTAIALRRADGSPFPDSWYDAESMVVEQAAGKALGTMLIGSETGPAIRRFDTATGRQVGPDLTIPDNLSYPPKGSAQQGRSIESLTVSPDGRYLYAGWEAPLAQDGDNRGANVLRIQRYQGSPGGAYVPAGQYAYRSGDGLNLADLVAVDDDHLLALERQYVGGLGNAIQVAELSLAGARDVSRMTSLYNLPANTYVQRALLFDLADCPAGGRGRVARSEPDQRNPLLDNVEGMALGPVWRDGPRKGWRPLLMVSDDNNSANQITRLYSLAVKL